MKKLLLIPIVALLFAGCSDTGTSALTTQQKVNENQKRLEKVVELPQLDSSLERINIKKRLETFDNEDKISYIYLVSYGRVMTFYTVKGKVTSGNKRLTTNKKLLRGDRGEFDGDYVVESPSLDGAYGSSDSYVFFWTTDGVYVQWSGDYMLVDQPLKLSTAPELVREIK